MNGPNDTVQARPIIIMRLEYDTSTHRNDTGLGLDVEEVLMMMCCSRPIPFAIFFRLRAKHKSQAVQNENIIVLVQQTTRERNHAPFARIAHWHGRLCDYSFANNDDRGFVVAKVYNADIDQRDDEEQSRQ